MSKSPTSFSAVALNCLLTVSAIRVTDNTSIAFTYVFRNDSPRVSFVFNRLYETWDQLGVPTVDPSMVNLAPEDGVVVLSKRLMAVPPGRFVETRNIPCLTRVAPGESINERLTVAMPAGQRSPYEIDASYRGVVEVRPAYFELGFFLAYPGREDVIPVVQTALGPVPCLRGFSDSSQSILRVGPLSDRFLFRR